MLIPNQGMPVLKTSGSTALLLKEEGDLILHSPFCQQNPQDTVKLKFTSTAHFRCAGCFPYIDPKHSLAGRALSAGGMLSLGSCCNKIFLAYPAIDSADCTAKPMKNYGVSENPRPGILFCQKNFTSHEK